MISIRCVIYARRLTAVTIGKAEERKAIRSHNRILTYAELIQKNHALITFDLDYHIVLSAIVRIQILTVSILAANLW